jgi:hypothetical protein
VSEYGHRFDRLAEMWRVLEHLHDLQHPDRSQCGGVGGCSMMAGAVDLKNGMIEAMAEWRERNPL